MGQCLKSMGGGNSDTTSDQFTPVVSGGGSSQAHSGFHQAYSLGAKLGSGTFSVVRQGTRKADQKKFAVKCIKDAGLSEEDKDALETEVEILKEVR